MTAAIAPGLRCSLTAAACDALADRRRDVAHQESSWSQIAALGMITGMFSPDRYTAALRFAARRHLTQKVPGSELPYVVHVTSVAAEVIATLATTRLDEPDVAIECALLHDTIEDTGVTFAELENTFGTAVAEGVQALSKNPALPKDEQMRDSLRRIRARPPAIWMVKLADRITNLAPPPAHWSAEKRAEYREEAIVIADALVGASAALDARIREKIEEYRAHL